MINNFRLTSYLFISVPISYHIDVKTFREKKQWMNDQRQKAKDIHQKAIDAGFERDWDIKAYVGYLQ